MSTTKYSLSDFIKGCDGHWENAIYIPCGPCANLCHLRGRGCLMTASPVGELILLGVTRYEQLTGQRIEPDLCLTSISRCAFDAAFFRYLLWELEGSDQCSLCHLESKTDPDYTDACALSRRDTRRHFQTQFAATNKMENIERDTYVFLFRSPSNAIKPNLSCIGEYSRYTSSSTPFPVANIFWKDWTNNEAYGVDSAASFSWTGLQKNSTIKFEILAGKAGEIGADMYTVQFHPGNGTFEEPDGKAPETKFVFYNNEELGTQEVYPSKGDKRLVLTIPTAKPNTQGDQFLGWELALSGQGDDAAVNGRIYSDEEVKALRYKDAYGVMTFTAKYGVFQAEISKKDGAEAKKFATVGDALARAVDGDTVKIVVDTGIIPAAETTMKSGVILTDNAGQKTYTAKEDSAVTVDDAGVLALVKGQVGVSPQTPVGAQNGENTHRVVTPNCDSVVFADGNGAPYIKSGEETAGTKSGVVTIDDVR